MNFERPKFNARQENRFEALKAFEKRCVSMSGSRTGFSKYSVSGGQNYFLQISVNNVKSLFIWLNTNFGEPYTRYIGIYNVDYYKMTGSQNV